jgi:hypothetical protein
LALHCFDFFGQHDHALTLEETCALLLQTRVHPAPGLVLVTSSWAWLVVSNWNLGAWKAVGPPCLPVLLIRVDSLRDAESVRSSNHAASLKVPKLAG